MTKILPLGTDNFRVIREEKKYYVDKTLLIKDFLDSKFEGILITRPRRFGKTMNMTMMRDFFDITKDNNALFTGLKIMETEYATKLNSIPVIYLTFKNCGGKTNEKMLVRIAREMFEEYTRYFNFFEGKIDQTTSNFKIFHSTLKMFQKVFETYSEENENHLDSERLQSSLKDLIKVVHEFTTIKPIVLIDEYDNPLICAHEKEFRKDFSDFYGDFLTEALKGNDYLSQAMLTGIQRVAKESIFSKLNHFVVYTVLDKKYSTYFGLTPDETAKVLQDFGLDLTEEIKGYYDGYYFGNTDIYNPWSIFSYLEKKELQPYWRNTSTNALIREAIASADSEFFESFDELILKGEADVIMNLEASFVELATTETLWGLLVNSGYLTISTDDKDVVRIPNLEAMKEFREIVANYTDIRSSYLEKLFKALAKNEMEKFLKYYKKIVYRYMSCHDVKENAYHMLLLGMSISVAGMYEIKSNIEEGNGRPDIFMESLQPHLRPHIIFEMKQGENVEKEKIKALQQVFDRKYYINLSGQILCVGVAHSKKECALAYKLITNY